MAQPFPDPTTEPIKLDRQTVCRLIDENNLVELQNHPANWNQDHLTICGFFTRPEQFASHAAALRQRISRFEAAR